MRDRLHEVSFAETRIAVDEKRIVDFARRLANRVSCGRRNVVRLSDDEKIEGVSVAQWRRGIVATCERRLHRIWWWSDKEIHLGPFLPFLVHTENDVQRMSENYRRV